MAKVYDQISGGSKANKYKNLDSNRANWRRRIL